MAPALARNLTSLFNTSLATENVPAVWKQANVTRVHKSGVETVIANFRPVSALLIWWPRSIFEKIVHQHLLVLL